MFQKVLTLTFVALVSTSVMAGAFDTIGVEPYGTLAARNLVQQAGLYTGSLFSDESGTVPAATAVPEPRSFMLLGLSLLGLAALRRRF